MVHSGYTYAVSRRVKQRGEQVQHRSLSKYSTGISSTQAVALWRRCRECVCKVDNSPEGQSSENNASGRRRTARLRYHLGPHTSPWWTGPEEPGAPSPSTLGTPTTLIERRQETTDKLSYVLVGSNRRIRSAVGIQKGNILPKWEVEASRCSIVGERAQSGARSNPAQEGLGTVTAEYAAVR